LRTALAGGAGARGRLPLAPSARLPGARGERPRVVRGLVRRPLLRGLARGRSPRSPQRHPARLPGRLLAPSDQDQPVRGALRDPARPALQRLRIPPRRGGSPPMIRHHPGRAALLAGLLLHTATALCVWETWGE